eukprot:3511717-Rhodomonas_salina.1
MPLASRINVRERDPIALSAPSGEQDRKRRQPGVAEGGKTRAVHARGAGGEWTHGNRHIVVSIAFIPVLALRIPVPALPIHPPQLGYHGPVRASPRCALLVHDG